MYLPSSLLPELPALLVIADELHFGRAAERLNISQPRVSQIVRRVEDIVGYEVFFRRPQVRLTPPGEAMINAARDALDYLGSGFARAAELAAGRSATVRLGYSPVAMFTHLPQLLKSAHRRDPRVSIELLEDDTARLWEGLEDGKFDIIVSREARVRPGIRNHLFLRDNMVAVLPSGDPAANESRLNVGKLRDRNFISIDEAVSPQWHHAMTSCCQSAGFDPRISMRVNDWPGILALVASGLGVSIVSSTLAQVPFPGIEFVPLLEGVRTGAFWVAYREEATDPAVEFLRTELVRGFEEGSIAA
jgi:DNA-binding transcriptional LysR family regulator